jgi:hypothetical protein
MAITMAYPVKNNGVVDIVAIIGRIKGARFEIFSEQRKLKEQN